MWQLQAGEDHGQHERRRLSSRSSRSVLRGGGGGGGGLGPVLSCPGSVLEVKESQDLEGQSRDTRGSRRSGGNLAMDWSSKPTIHLRSSHVNSVVTLPRKPRGVKSSCVCSVRKLNLYLQSYCHCQCRTQANNGGGGLQ